MASSNGVTSAASGVPSESKGNGVVDATTTQAGKLDGDLQDTSKSSASADSKDKSTIVTDAGGRTVSGAPTTVGKQVAGNVAVSSASGQPPTQSNLLDSQDNSTTVTDSGERSVPSAPIPVGKQVANNATTSSASGKPQTQGSLLDAPDKSITKTDADQRSVPPEPTPVSKQAAGNATTLGADKAQALATNFMNRVMDRYTGKFAKGQQHCFVHGLPGRGVAVFKELQTQRTEDFCDLVAEACSQHPKGSCRFDNIDISETQWTSEGILNLLTALSAYECRVQRLKMYKCGITDDGIFNLSTYLDQLPKGTLPHEIHLSGNEISSEGFKEFWRACERHLDPPPRVPVWIRIEANRIQKEDIQRLVQAHKICEAHQCKTAYCQEIGMWPGWRPLAHMKLWHQQKGGSGLAAITAGSASSTETGVKPEASKSKTTPAAAGTQTAAQPPNQGWTEPARFATSPAAMSASTGLPPSQASANIPVLVPPTRNVGNSQPSWLAATPAASAQQAPSSFATTPAATFHVAPPQNYSKAAATEPPGRSKSSSAQPPTPNLQPSQAHQGAPWRNANVGTTSTAGYMHQPPGVFAVGQLHQPVPTSTAVPGNTNPPIFGHTVNPTGPRWPSPQQPMPGQPPAAAVPPGQPPAPPGWPSPRRPMPGQPTPAAPGWPPAPGQDPWAAYHAQVAAQNAQLAAAHQRAAYAAAGGVLGYPHQQSQASGYVPGTQIPTYPPGQLSPQQSPAPGSVPARPIPTYPPQQSPAPGSAPARPVPTYPPQQSPAPGSAPARQVPTYPPQQSPAPGSLPVRPAYPSQQSPAPGSVPGTQETRPVLTQVAGGLTTATAAPVRPVMTQSTSSKQAVQEVEKHSATGAAIRKQSEDQKKGDQAKQQAPPKIEQRKKKREVSRSKSNAKRARRRSKSRSRSSSRSRNRRRNRSRRRGRSRSRNRRAAVVEVSSGSSSESSDARQKKVEKRTRKEKDVREDEKEKEQNELKSKVNALFANLA